ncbi:MAG: acetylglutamate kinase [Candidatus Dormibacteraeota bacterium]|uniref:Acetylglutamate kinase n=1 Tax=Candidatus Aeolococcus gillhamiae TaxID=3127015 RepID=A0A2W6AMK8_9BACT|nr:acetylglutamate kinase [Candidatus Dormibacteraeota bacterium]PZR78961.1 MAG: acetylglutamate kinase [Candidatus Dormibacter sp. RRmetagenome_bin12]
MDERLRRAHTLIDALPYIRRFSGHTMVIKLGGAAAAGADIDAVLQDIVLLRFVGMRPVLVHGGGPEISSLQERMGMTPRFVNGLRVTDEATMEVVKMVLTGKVGPDLVSRIHRLGGSAIGLSGEDGPTLLVRPARSESGEDLGRVGEVDHVNVEPILSILDQGRIPVVASIGLGYDGEGYNVNADTVAAELAVALRATKLILLTDVDGVHDRDGTLLSELDRERATALAADGVITGGMLPKVKAALRALDGVEATHIIDGRVPHALLLELLTPEGVGTMFGPGVVAVDDR